MEVKAHLMDEAQMNRSMARIAHEIIEHNEDLTQVCLLGIRRRGIPLARILQENIQKFADVKVPLGTIDISLYRDDLSELGEEARTGECMIPVNLKQYHVILVDDVLYTGRTARAAIEAVFAHGRARSIQLAILIDRGHRELPIRPDYVGKNIPTSRSEMVMVKVPEYDGACGVDLVTL
jgi:pyrimidine operon attenuation protein/uracil phosphoribosyltransferase